MANLSKFIMLIILQAALCLPLCAQRSVKEMRGRVKELQQAIDAKNSVILSKGKDIKSKLRNIDIISEKVNDGRELLSALSAEVKLLDDSISRLDNSIKAQHKRVDIAKKNYSTALRAVRRHGSFKEKLLFILSASDFNTMVRRYRYAREYMNAHRKVGEQLKAEIELLNIKLSSLDSLRADKRTALDEQHKYQEQLTSLEAEQRSIVAQLEKERRNVQKELDAEKKRLQKLNAEINRLIAEEIKAQQKAKSSHTAAKQPGKADSKGTAKSDAGVGQLSGSFAASKGKLPIPITGEYHAVNEFGRRKGVLGKGNVMLDKKGMTFYGVDNARVRCVYDGTVTSAIKRDDYAFVIVKHGKYSTAYIGISNIMVERGQKLKAGDILGNAAVDADGKPSLLFQIWGNGVAVNPAGWLRN